jgi:hypothetical protein
MINISDQRYLEWVPKLVRAGVKNINLMFMDMTHDEIVWSLEKQICYAKSKKVLKPHRITQLHSRKLDRESNEFYILYRGEHDRHYHITEIMKEELQKYQDCPWNKLARKLDYLDGFGCIGYKNEVMTEEVFWVFQNVKTLLKSTPFREILTPKDLFFKHSLLKRLIKPRKNMDNKEHERLQLRAEIRKLIKPINSNCLGYGFLDVDEEEQIIERIERVTKLVRVLSCLVLEYVIV